MFDKKRERSDIEMSLLFSFKMTFDELTHLGNNPSDLSDSNSIGKGLHTKFRLCNTVELAGLISKSINTDTGRYKEKKHVLEIKVTGSLGGQDINECFSTVDDFNSFMEKNVLLPPLVPETTRPK